MKGAASTAEVVVHKGPSGRWCKNARGILLLPCTGKADIMRGEQH